jgi:DNA-binding IclR family transcriptional regulator
MPVGQRSPLYCGGSSKAILAFSDEETVERVFARPFRKFTGNTITGMKAMREEIRRIRGRGYAVSHGERVEGITSISITPGDGITPRRTGEIDRTGGEI